MEALYRVMGRIGWILTGLIALIGGAWLLDALRFERLGQPLLLAALGLLLPLGWLLWRSRRLSHKRLLALIEHPLLGRMAQTAGLQSGSGPSWRQGLLWLAVLASLIVALARPQGPPAVSQLEGSGVDILMALDISDSTKAPDEYPNRLQAAKKGIAGLLSQLPGDRIGVLVFSGEAFPIAPFTSDYGALIGILDEIDHGMLPNATTELGETLKVAKERFAAGSEDSGKVLVLFSDGENQQGDWKAELKALNDLGIRVFTVGLGSQKGARIPEQNPYWGTLGYKTWQGQEVITRLDENTLKQIASGGQGRYLHLDQIGQLPGLLNQARGQLQVSRSVSSGAMIYQERFQAWLLLACLLGLLERILAARKPRAPRPAKRPSAFARILQQLSRKAADPRVAVSLVLLPLLNSAWHWPWEGFIQDWQGKQRFEQKKYDEAAKDFQQGLEAKPEDPALLHNQGSARYRAEQYHDAAEAYRKSAEASAAPPEAKAQSWYNLGNSLYRKGEKGSQSGKSEQTQADWQKAIEAYQQALQLNPRDTQALENLNYVQEQLQQLQQQQQQQGNQNQPDKNQDQQQNQQNQQQDQQQNQGGQGSQGGQQNQPPQKDASSPLDNRFTDQEIENYLDYLEQSEHENRDQFQRVPNARRTPDPLNDPLDQLGEGSDKDPNLKDW